MKNLPVRIFSFGIIVWGAWVVWTQRARFDVGGSETGTSRPIRVNADGVDAIFIGVFIMGVGILGIAQTMKGPLRIPTAVVGLAAVLVPAVYGLAMAGYAIYSVIAALAAQ